MKGDFSRWDFDPARNFAGTLQQQGRVLLDADWNAQTRITGHWQDTSARDTIGPGVAAVPAENSDAFRVTHAWVEDDEVKVRLEPGRVWADALLTYLDGYDLNAGLPASYLAQPVHDPEISPSPTPGARDAVILEVWREAINGFQLPRPLIEPALGGPDTTERIHTAMAIRLLRLANEETCQNIRGRLSSDRDNRGHLRVSLQPTTTTEGDCPVVAAGGYSGFEHNLYRIEIAQVEGAAGDFFKWSQFNGGLVGRGNCDLSGEGTARRISITANTQAITSSGLTSFYLEVLEPVPLGPSGPEGICHWRVTYGALAELDGEDLVIAEDAPRYHETDLPVGNIFFRLWNGIESVDDFVLAITRGQELQDGIMLDFDRTPGQVYHPGDYWTFAVRADSSNESILLDDQPPEGILYHRVPIAVLAWTNDGNIPRVLEENILDCRRVFRPLTRQNVCCTVTVGDGISTHGDFDSIQQAVEYLRPDGGEICVLPGTHRADVLIEDFHGTHLRVKGCGLRSRLLGKPVFKIVNSASVALENMELSSANGTAIDVTNSSGIEISNNHIFACICAICTEKSKQIWICHNKIRMLDKTEGRAAVYFGGEQGLIERNEIAAFPHGKLPTPQAGDPTYSDPADDECIEWDSVLENVVYVSWFYRYLSYVWSFDAFAWLASLDAPHTYRAQGGIQIGGASEGVRILGNRILGGAGNGITLGGDLSVIEPEDGVGSSELHFRLDGGRNVFMVASEGAPVPNMPVIVRSESRLLADVSNERGYATVDLPSGVHEVSISVPAAVGAVSGTEKVTDEVDQRVTVLTMSMADPDQEREKSAGIYEVSIDDNKILGMGLSGIGTSRDQRDIGYGSTDPTIVADYLRSIDGTYVNFSRSGAFSVSTVPVGDLIIQNNHISRCLQQPPTALHNNLGQGGVSLGTCENLMIRENRINDNGVGHIYPVCGIYASVTANVDISGNKISDNGPVVPGTGHNKIVSGIRGGIVLETVRSKESDLHYAVSAILISPPGVYEEGIHGEPTAATSMGMDERGGTAARIEGNLVKHPFGSGLWVNAAGSLLVIGNQFCVATTPKYALYVYGSESSPIEFSHNQMILSISKGGCIAQALHSDTDLSFSNNQCEILRGKGKIFINTKLTSFTSLRATGNRLAEHPKGQEQVVSLYTSASHLSTVTNNQIDHCLLTNEPDNKHLVGYNSSLYNANVECGGSSDSQTKSGDYVALVFVGGQ